MTAPAFEFFLIIARNAHVQNLVSQTARSGFRAVTHLVNKWTTPKTVSLDSVPTQQAQESLLLKIDLINRLVQSNNILRDYCASKGFFHSDLQRLEKIPDHVVDRFVEEENYLNNLQFEYGRKLRILESDQKIYGIFCQMLSNEPKRKDHCYIALADLAETSIP